MIGVPALDGSGNELPRAYVVTDRSKIDEAAIKNFVKSNAAQYKQILRKDLRELAKLEAEAALLKAKL